MGNANARKAGRKAVAVPGPAQVAGGLDQAQPLPKLSDYLEKVVATVSSTKATLASSLGMLHNLNGIGKLSAIGTAAALWHMRDRWEKLSGKEFDNVAGRDADFQEYIFGEVGYMPDTTRRYCQVMDFLQEAKVNLGAKSTVWESLLQRDIKDLIALGQYTSEHGLLSKKQLSEAALVADSSELRKKLNEFKGKEEGAGGSQIVLQKDGSLEFWVGDVGENIGFLPEPKSDIAKRGRAALIRRAKIVEK